MRTRLGLKVLGLSALVIGVMVIGTAGVAQAETGACWGYRVNPESALNCFTTSLEAKLKVVPEAGGATLLVGSKNIEVTCTTAAFVNGGTLSANGSILLGQVLFGGCISRTKTTLAALGVCKPNDPVDGLGTIITEKGTGLIVLHSGQPVVELTPDVITPLDILAKIFLGKECSVGEELIVEGRLVLQDMPTVAPEPVKSGKERFETHMLTHLIREFPGLQKMTVGAVLATIDGTANVTLESPHNTLEWAGKPA